MDTVLENVFFLRLPSSQISLPAICQVSLKGNLALRHLVSTVLLRFVLSLGHSEEMNNKCEQEEQVSSTVKLIRLVQNEMKFAIR